MGRVARIDIANEIYHVLNRANVHMTVFNKNKDFREFEEIIEESIIKSKPLGDSSLAKKVVDKFGLEMTMRNPGRPQEGT